MLYKVGRKYQHDCLYLQSINSINHKYIKTTFRLCCLYSYLVHVRLIKLETIFQMSSFIKSSCNASNEWLSWDLIRQRRLQMSSFFQSSCNAEAAGRRFSLYGHHEPRMRGGEGFKQVLLFDNLLSLLLLLLLLLN